MFSVIILQYEYSDSDESEISIDKEKGLYGDYDEWKFYIKNGSVQNSNQNVSRRNTRLQNVKNDPRSYKWTGFPSANKGIQQTDHAVDHIDACRAISQLSRDDLLSALDLWPLSDHIHVIARSTNNWKYYLGLCLPGAAQRGMVLYHLHSYTPKILQLHVLINSTHLGHMGWWKVHSRHVEQLTGAQMYLGHELYTCSKHGCLHKGPRGGTCPILVFTHRTHLAHIREGQCVPCSFVPSLPNFCWYPWF